jgi:hypothetical protein
MPVQVRVLRLRFARSRMNTDPINDYAAVFRWLMLLITLSIAGLQRRKCPVEFLQGTSPDHDVLGQGAGLDSLQVISQVIRAGRTDQHRGDIPVVHDES